MAGEFLEVDLGTARCSVEGDCKGFSSLTLVLAASLFCFKEVGPATSLTSS